MRETGGSLVVVGAGLMAVSDLTNEARNCISSSSKVFYVVDNPVIEAWLLKQRSDAISLARFYAVGVDRGESYHSMVSQVVQEVVAGNDVCMVLYGHPGVCCITGHMAINECRARGLSGRMYPGISALDWLVSDLGVDLIAEGLQTYGATDFLVRRPRVDIHSYLVLWQVGLVGESTYQLKFAPPQLKELAAVLIELYGWSHSILFYQASAHVLSKPIVRKLQLDQLVDNCPAWAITVVIPPSTN